VNQYQTIKPITAQLRQFRSLCRRSLSQNGQLQGWAVCLRLYGPLEPWFNKTWRPGEIELVK